MKKNITLFFLTLTLIVNTRGNISINPSKNTQKCFNIKNTQPNQKKWNFLVYITSNNNLYPFSITNINQMKEIGSNKNINILVQQDVYGKLESKRIFIEKNNQKIIERIITPPESISGTPESLYGFVEWALKNYPAKYNALILWDHGSGIIDPNMWKTNFKFNPLMLYKINTTTGLFELNRDLIDKRGICFNEIFEIYLTNQDLNSTLAKISTNLLNGKKLDIIGMDACNMAMLEIGVQIKKYAKYMVASEEAEPGEGWNYGLILKPFEKKSLNPKIFCKHIVSAYQKHYEGRYEDFTQSAINLKKLDLLEININNISKELIKLLESNKKQLIISEIKKLRQDKTKTTKFANPNYIDLYHFYSSLNKLTEKTLKTSQKDNITKTLKNIKNLTQKGKDIINNIVLKRTFCSSLPFAQGISFYFPTIKIHKSYKKINFAKKNNWINFLKKYI